MKNLSSSYLFNSQEYRLALEDDRPALALTQGLYHQVEDWVALELTAEQMLNEEMTLVTTYVADDAKQVWVAIKDSLLPYELAVGQFLLNAADPSQVEWQRSHWWSQAAH